MRISLSDRTACGTIHSLSHILTHCPSTYTRYSGLHPVSLSTFSHLWRFHWQVYWKAVSAYILSLIHKQSTGEKMNTAPRLQQQATVMPPFLLSPARQSSTSVDKFPRMRDSERETDSTVGNGIQADYSKLHLTTGDWKWLIFFD